MQRTIHPIEGTVTHKHRDQDHLLITVSTQEGTILATFQKQITEMDLLIAKGDTVTFDLRHYEPFVRNPSVVRVIKQKEPEQLPQSSQGLSSVQSNDLQDVGSAPREEPFDP